MTKVALIAIILCAICGVVYGIVKISTQTQETKTSQQNDSVTAVYANRDIARGTILAKADLIEKEIEKSSAPYDFVPTVGLATGRYSRVAMKQGEIVLMHNLIVRPSGYIRIQNSPGK